jgi:hypothetical protein
MPYASGSYGSIQYANALYFTCPNYVIRVRVREDVNELYTKDVEFDVYKNDTSSNNNIGGFGIKLYDSCIYKENSQYLYTNPENSVIKNLQVHKSKIENNDTGVTILFYIIDNEKPVQYVIWLNNCELYGGAISYDDNIVLNYLPPSKTLPSIFKPACYGSKSNMTNSQGYISFYYPNDINCQKLDKYHILYNIYTNPNKVEIAITNNGLFYINFDNNCNIIGYNLYNNNKIHNLTTYYDPSLKYQNQSITFSIDNSTDSKPIQFRIWFTNCKPDGSAAVYNSTEPLRYITKPSSTDVMNSLNKKLYSTYNTTNFNDLSVNKSHKYK